MAASKEYLVTVTYKSRQIFKVDGTWKGTWVTMTRTHKNWAFSADHAERGIRHQYGFRRILSVDVEAV